MSIINNTYKFIYVHIPKTAGTSVSVALSQYTKWCDFELGGTEYGEKIQSIYFDRFGIAKHSSAENIYKLVGPKVWSEYFTFSVVRNPFKRALSTFNFLQKWQSPLLDFNKYINRFNSFEEYVMSDIWDTTDGPDDIFKPQLHWLSEKIESNNLLVKKICRVENLEEDLNLILNSIPYISKSERPVILKINSSNSSNEKITFPQRVVDKIIEKYKCDFQLFEYSHEPNF